MPILQRYIDKEISMLKKELEKRDLPKLPSREEMIEIIQREEFGYLPTPEKYTVTASAPTVIERRYNCGAVTHSFVDLTVEVGGGSHTFRVDRFLHVDGNKRPLVILNNIHPADTSPYFSKEELSEYDVDYLVFAYKDVTSDDGDFTTGLAPLLLPNGRDTDTACGKIGIWAWAAMRVLDYGLTLKGTDPDNVAIAGHSRLGKTAAFTAMMDERFKFAFSNAAGCAGDSLSRGSSGFGREVPRDKKRGELIEDITESFPYWFSKNYLKYRKTNIPEGFDQHFLIGAIAPRFVMIGSCDFDAWADPKSQQLCALAASEAWEREGYSGLIGGEERYLGSGEGLIEGRVGYFKIHSLHMLSRHSWRFFLSFIEKHRYEKIK